MELSDIRKDIDVIDNELKALFVKRMALSKEVASVKAKSGASVYNAAREAEIIENLSSDIDEDYKEDYIAWIKQMLASSRNYQNKLIEEQKAK
jgi:Chorismate mutase